MTATGKIANNGLRLSLHHRNVGYVAKRAKICIRERRRMNLLSEVLKNNDQVSADSNMCTDKILDLSFKKATNSSGTSDLNSSLATITTHNRDNQFSEFENKSPSEVRNFMITPPSESDSPTKIKSELIHNYLNTSANIAGQDGGLAILPMNIPIVSNILPTLLNRNDGRMTNGPITSMTNCNETALPNLSADVSKKPPRPFKAYPKDPLSLTVGAAELMYDPNSNEAYSEFRKRMLESVKKTYEGTNTKMRRTTKSPVLPTSTVDEKDAAYLEKRRKNNEAAKRSRDARRAKEDEIAIRAAFLEQENMRLKYELLTLRKETEKLKRMIYTH
ncbi:Hepatic leukemia factor [Melipona quadrifasciata]|uniref:Hepatic leukemia factor n=1 Tax=Melipona quadrifasciata TaxID=166423 RepID=A0A0N1ITN0_9HYME|nr:Hepatic leukemia factor [Melipona quadrifasciata]